MICCLSHKSIAKVKSPVRNKHIPSWDVPKVRPIGNLNGQLFCTTLRLPIGRTFGTSLPPLHKCSRATVNRRLIIQKVSALEEINAFAKSQPVYIIAKGIILFTLFYATMNWWHYRSLRKDSETDDGKE